MRGATYHWVISRKAPRPEAPRPPTDPGITEAVEAFWDAVIADTDRVCEAIGPDGLQYPFPTRFIGLSEWERQARRIQVSAFDDAFYREVGEAIRNNDAAELGRLILAHARPYLEGRFDDWLEDNRWRFYE